MDGGSGPRSRLTSPGGQSIEIEGVRLEAQFRCAHGYLLIATDDVPFEETLRFYLLDEELSIMDGMCLGQIYRPGIFNLVRFAEDRLDFTFFSEEIWRLEILTEPLLKLLPTPFAIARYRDGWLKSHYLRLRRLT
jgi:hypothetical protein